MTEQGNGSTLAVIKMQGLLEQLTESSEILANEYRLLTKNNLKVAQNIEILNKTVESLHQVSPAIIKQIKETSIQEINNVFKSLSDAVGKNIDLKLDDFCRKLNSESTKITNISDHYKKLSRKMLLIIIGISVLVVIVLGVVMEYFTLKCFKRITGFFSYTIHKK